MGLGYVLDDQGSEVQASAGQKVAPRYQRVQIGSDVHPIPNLVSTAGSFSTGKVAGSEGNRFLSSGYRKKVSSVVPLLSPYDFKECSLTTMSFAVPLHNNKAGANI
jgi:hypothetical protein